MNPGSSFRGLHDSLVNHGGNLDPRLLLCLHEEVAVSLAHGWSKATGRLGVAAVHDLVGLMHASMAVYDAFCDRTPLLLLGGSGPADPAQRRPIDWIHSATTQAQLVRDYCVWDAEPMTAQASVDDVARAAQRAMSAPRGPAYVSLDAGVQEAGAHRPGPAARPGPARPRPAHGARTPASLAAAADLLAGARRPVVVAGRVGLDPARHRRRRRRSSSCWAPATATTATRSSCRRCTRRTRTGDPDLLAGADVVLAVDVVDLAALLRRRDRGPRAAVRPPRP